MTFREWARGARSHLADEGLVSGGRTAAYEFYLGMWRQLGRRVNYGRRIYDHEWDLLVVLDACRADLVAEVVDEFDFLDRDTAYSCASASGEWYRKNFGDEYRDETARTALVSANLYTDAHVDPEDFRLVDEVWRYAFDADEGTIPPESVVDRTVSVCRELDPDRTVAHFMQPHYPFVPHPRDFGEGIAKDYDGRPWSNVWERLQAGEASYEEVWEGYRQNLVYVLEHVAVLLDNVDAERVVITSDHGNLLGEFGLYDHPQYVPIPALKRVPWVVTSAEDTGSYEPSEELADRETGSVREKLEALGYV